MDTKRRQELESILLTCDGKGKAAKREALEEILTEVTRERDTYRDALDNWQERLAPLFERVENTPEYEKGSCIIQIALDVWDRQTRRKYRVPRAELYAAYEREGVEL